MSLATLIPFLTFITLNVFAVRNIKKEFPEMSFIGAVQDRKSWGITAMQVQFWIVLSVVFGLVLYVLIQAFAILDAIKLVKA